MVVDVCFGTVVVDDCLRGTGVVRVTFFCCEVVVTFVGGFVVLELERFLTCVVVFFTEIVVTDFVVVLATTQLQTLLRGATARSGKGERDLVLFV